MATLRVLVTKPQANAFVGRRVQVNGRVQVVPSGAEVTLMGASVRLGQDGPFEEAAIAENSWRYTGTLPGGNDGPLEITATAEGLEIRGGEPVEISGSTTVMVIADRTAPAVVVDFPRDVTTTSLPYPMTVKGSAEDLGAGVQEVRYSLDGGPFALVDNISGDWSEWSKTIDLAAAKEYVITFQAADKLENRWDEDFPFVVNLRFEAGLAFDPTTFLQELIAFAGRWIKVGDTDAGPSAGDLAGRFFQPFDRLTQSNLYEQATRLLHRSRIAVEVLRARLRQMNQSVPAQVERRFRRAAYEAILFQLGTSHEELRAARIAPEASRRALAERLGFSLESTRPDRLDRITLMPDQVTEGQLEQLFGFERTTQTDPLEPRNLSAQILSWRLASTRDRWLLEDGQTRDGAAGPMPVIDPDLVDKANLRRTTAGDRVYDLWKARKDWVDGKLAEAASQRPQGFERVIQTFIGALDFAALAAQDANGEDICPTLEPLHLDLTAFRFLARCQLLAAAGALLDTEWRDVLDIVVQVQKKRQYRQWRDEETGLALAPQYFRPSDQQQSSPELSSWRVPWPVYAAWHRILGTRVGQYQDLKDAYQTAVDRAEAQALPMLRDSLIEVIGRQTPPEPGETAAERLSRDLVIDLRASGDQKITRVDQAIETLLGAIFSVRAGRHATGPSGSAWSIAIESEFDKEWRWMAAYQNWRAAMMICAYPESQLYPHLFVTEEPLLNPTKPFLGFVAGLRETARITPLLAREKAGDYLQNLRHDPGTDLPDSLRADTFVISDDVDLNQRKDLLAVLFPLEPPPEPHTEANYLREVFWLVPMALALQLQKAGDYLAALDWYQTVYSFNLPPEDRKIYPGLVVEERIITQYGHITDWLRQQLNPHIFARQRKNAYTRFTVLCIARCFLEFADSEFAQNTAESVGRARTLYQTAEDLLRLPDIKPETGENVPLLPNPVWESLRLHAQANLSKIHQGMNIAGVPAAALSFQTASVQRPSQYRSAVLIERAKQLVAIAQQVESAFLAAMERRDDAAYSLMQAGHDLRLAGATVTLQDLKIADADLSIRMAELQRDKAQIQVDHFQQQINEGLNFWEDAALVSMRVAIYLQSSAAVMFSVGAGLDTLKALVTFGLWGDPAGSAGRALSALSDVASLTAGFAQTKASFERREQEWQFQKSLSEKDVQIGVQQVLLALNQREMAVQERKLAGIQLEHATAVVDFLVNKFTNAELYEWMSGVLSGVYSYFLQQATAMAQLGQSQLAFERQEPALSAIRSDYWLVTAEDSSAAGTDGTAPDRRGLTGSVRLLQDITRLDQYAFETQQRKLQLTQTLSLTQLAPIEFQHFRETGRLIFATPMDLFDRDFPGHYLRLIRRVRGSVVALVPPARGIRATLSTSGISSVVTGGTAFETIHIHRSPETIAFTSPINATGLFELEPEGGMLLPFEGIGVDTFWEFQLPKAANPFDYRAIADVLLTIEYTALYSPVYRQQVIPRLGRTASGDRIFSFRQQFADAWYELNNADAIEDPQRRMVVAFSTRFEDFPPHLQDLRIRHITFLMARRNGFTNELEIRALKFTPEGETASVGGAASTVAGIVSTRRPNGSALLPTQGKTPAGKWELRLPNTNQVKYWFKDGAIEDLALIVTFEGTTPEWPL